MLVTTMDASQLVASQGGSCWCQGILVLPWVRQLHAAKWELPPHRPVPPQDLAALAWR